MTEFEDKQNREIESSFHFEENSNNVFENDLMDNVGSAHPICETCGNATQSKLEVGDRMPRALVKKKKTHPVLILCDSLGHLRVQSPDLATETPPSWLTNSDEDEEERDKINGTFNKLDAGSYTQSGELETRFLYNSMKY